MPDYLSIAREALERPKELRQSAVLEDVLKGSAIELWSDAAGRLFVVADEDDARRLGELRGTVYTGAELRRVVQIGDPAIVLEIHEWKRAFNGRVREVQKHGERGEGHAPREARLPPVNGDGGRA
jgi:hypothetical protein